MHSTRYATPVEVMPLRYLPVIQRIVGHARTDGFEGVVFELVF